MCGEKVGSGGARGGAERAPWDEPGGAGSAEGAGVVSASEFFQSVIFFSSFLLARIGTWRRLFPARSAVLGAFLQAPRAPGVPCPAALWRAAGLGGPPGVTGPPLPDHAIAPLIEDYPQPGHNTRNNTLTCHRGSRKSMSCFCQISLIYIQELPGT